MPCHTLGVISLSLPGGMSSWCESSSFRAAFLPKHVYFQLKMRLLYFHPFPALTLGLLFSVSSHLAFCSTVPITDKAHGQWEAAGAAPVSRGSRCPQQTQQQLCVELPLCFSDLWRGAVCSCPGGWTVPGTLLAPGCVARALWGPGLLPEGWCPWEN